MPALRLGPGEYAAPWAVARWTRLRFLEAVRRHCPEVLEDLAGRLPLLGDGELPPSLEELARAPEWSPLRAGLEEWAERWNLRAEWVLDVALRTLTLWRRCPTLAGKAWAPVLHGRLLRPALDLPSLVLEWDPAAAPRRAAEEAVRQHLNRLEAEAHRRDELKPAPKKYSPEHFEWLALRVVQGLKPREIARRYARPDGGPSEAAVAMATNELARLIGLSISTAKRGRQG